MFQFIRRERIYIWMIFFILAVNLMNLGQPSRKAYDEKPHFSTKTFKEIGITEEKVKEFFESKSAAAEIFKYVLLILFFVFILSLILNLRFIFRKEEIVFKIEPGDRSVSWGILDVFRAGIIIAFTGYILSIVEGFIFKLSHINMDLNLRMIVSTFFIDIAAGIVILYFVILKYKEKLASLGLKLSTFYKNISAGVTAYIFVLPILLSALLLSILLLDFLGYKPQPQPVFDMFFEEKRSNVLLFLTIFVSLFGPIIEEMFFRGFMYSAIKKRFGVLQGALWSAVMFSTLHTNIVGFLPILVLGVLMAYLYETTGSLITSITVHVLHNSTILIFVFFIKQLIS